MKLLFFDEFKLGVLKGDTFGITLEPPGGTIQPTVPPFVAIPYTPQKPGYLGIRYSPLQTNASPAPGKPFNVRGITLSRGLTITALEKRTRLLRDAQARGARTVSGPDSILKPVSVAYARPRSFFST